MDAIVCPRRENVHVNFHCKVCVTLKFCYKIAWVPCKSDDFSGYREKLADLYVQISATPLLGLVNIFQQYLQHTYVSIHIGWNVREA